MFNKMNSLYLITWGFVIGIFFASLSHRFFNPFEFFILIILIFILLYNHKTSNLESQQKTISLLLFTLFIIFGAWHFNSFYLKKVGEHQNLIQQKINDTFVVIDEPDIKKWHTKLTIQFQNSEDKLITWTQNLPKYQYGDKLQISGWLFPIKNFHKKNDDIASDFDYINYLKKDGIFYEIKNPKITFLEHNSGNVIKEKLFDLKKILVTQIKKLLPEPESSLLAGILIGAKENLSEKTLNDFRKTGVIHIVVLSGFNLSILAEFIIIILSIFGRKISAIFGSISIILFAIMTGASATIVRASLMALLIILAKTLGRQAEALKLLFLAAFLMLLFNPMLLVYDPSFQLSFLATLGLIILAPKIQSWFKSENYLLRNLQSVFAATIAAQVFVFPLIIYMMGTISLISPLVNILILLLIPISMIYGLITTIISFFWFDFAKILSYLNFLVLDYDMNVIKFFADFKYSTLKLSNFGVGWLFSIYFIYVWIYLWQKKK